MLQSGGSVRGAERDKQSCQKYLVRGPYLFKKLKFIFNWFIAVGASFTAGAAALIYQYFSDGFYPTGRKNPDSKQLRKPSASLIKAMLLHSTIKARGYYKDKILHKDMLYPDNNQGFGIVVLDQ